MARTSTAETIASDVYASIRADILTGVFAPGAHLKTVKLCRDYGGVSLTVLREALNRLVSQRLVVARRNQGFYVTDVTPKGIRDLTSIRVLNEGHALALSIERGDFDWESRVVAAHHVLKRTKMRQPGERRGTSEEWSLAHRNFHEELISACDVPLLLEMCDSLLDGSELYRRVASRVGHGDRDVTKEHADLMDAAVSRDADLAQRLFADHLERTTVTVLTALGAPDSIPVVGSIP